MNVEVIVEGLENNPQCFHGPCLLFRQNNEKPKEYYACSACRDRKECPFYMGTSDKRLEKLKNFSKWITLRKETLESFLKKNQYKKYLKILKLLKSRKETVSGNSSVNTSKKPVTTTAVSYCYTCEELFDNSDLNKHTNCSVLKNLTEHQLRHPTEILVPKEDSKLHAQYFFTRKTVSNIVLLLSKLKMKRVLCIGTPRIHEYLLNECDTQFESMLLDIDMKYYNFYNDKKFIWYNMFNNCILKEDCSKYLEDFLKCKKVIVLMDPPFGGRVEPLAFTVDALSKLYHQVNKLDNSKSTADMITL